MKFHQNLTLNTLISIIGLAILARAIEFPLSLLGQSLNFSPLDAMALFTGVYFTRRTAILITLLSVWLGDFFINRMYFEHWVLFYQGCYWQYGCYALITLLGSSLNFQSSGKHFFIATISSSTLFFIISNFGVWTSGLLYPLNLSGLTACYIAAIPFFKQTLLSDLFYSLVFFVSTFIIQKKFSNLLQYKRSLG